VNILKALQPHTQNERIIYYPVAGSPVAAATETDAGAAKSEAKTNNRTA
jgi:hypothetical protein